MANCLFDFTSAGLAVLFLTQKRRMHWKTSFTVRASVFDNDQKKYNKQCNDTNCFQHKHLKRRPNGTQNCKNQSQHTGNPAKSIESAHIPTLECHHNRCSNSRCASQIDPGIVILGGMLYNSHSQTGKVPIQNTLDDAK